MPSDLYCEAYNRTLEEFKSKWLRSAVIGRYGL